MAELKRSPSFSLRKSLDTQRFRRKHANSTSAFEEPPPPVPVPVRAATTHHDDSKPSPSRRQSVRDFWKQNVSQRVSRRGKRRTRIDGSGSNRQSRVVNFSAMSENDKMLRRDDSSEFSFEPSVRASAYNTNSEFKPLSAHPPPSRMATVAEEPTPRALREADMRKMFFGAPQFSVTGTRDYPQPQATYRDVDPDSTHDGRDFHDLQHSSFELATLHAIDGDSFLGQIDRTASNALEIPSMLSLNGLEPGTVGLDHFLQMPLADGRTGAQAVQPSSKQPTLTSDPERLGLRPMHVERFIDRLAELGELQANRDDEEGTIVTAVNEQKASEMYADLFAKLLMPPKYSAAADDDPTGLDVQIAALIKALGLPDIWYNLSNPEQRLHLGQIIWAAQGQPDGVEVTVNRNTLLFQITLASELLTRLELNKQSVGRQDPSKGDTSTKRAPKITKKIAWDLVLAKRFLQDVCIAPGTVDSDKSTRDQNRSSVFSMMSFVTAREDFEEDEEIQPILHPRHERTQLNGLLSFAMALDWPHVDELKQKVSTRLKTDRENAKQSYTTPVATPGFKPDDRDSYFGVLVRPHAGRTATSQSVQLLPPVESAEGKGDAMNAAGWLSRSWLTGLVMPGEATCHLLMSTLLENSSSALHSLGDTANLYGGFYYKNKSYWSKGCIVGRVLGAMEGARGGVRDCMGWISIPDPAPQRVDGWINIDSSPVLGPTKPRIKLPNLIAEDSAPYPQQYLGQIQESDLTWPTDGPPILGNDIKEHTLSFEPSDTTYELSKTETERGSSDGISAISTSAAILTFTPPRSTKLSNLSIRLRYDVSFVSSQPCFPKMRTPLNTPSKTGASKDKELPAPPCHPLYKDYTYNVIPALSILSGDERLAALEKDEDEEGQGRARQDSGAGKQNSPKAGSDAKSQGTGVVMLDCRGSSELQLLARAWCAQVGEHALIGRVERTCVSCCVREARGLGMNIVIRV